MSDGAGLCLWVTTAEGKLWRWGCKSDGKNKVTSYRKYPDIGLAKAKELQGGIPLTPGSRHRSDGCKVGKKKEINAADKKHEAAKLSLNRSTHTVRVCGDI